MCLGSSPLIVPRLVDGKKLQVVRASKVDRKTKYQGLKQLLRMLPKKILSAERLTEIRTLFKCKEPPFGYAKTWAFNVACAQALAEVHLALAANYGHVKDPTPGTDRKSRAIVKVRWLNAKEGAAVVGRPLDNDAVVHAATELTQPFGSTQSQGEHAAEIEKQEEVQGAKK